MTLVTLSHKEETSKKVSQKGVPLILKLIGKANSLTGKKWKNNDVIYYRITQCLKITEKVSFNIASEANYSYILSGQKLIKNAKNGSFWRVFENLKLAVKQCYQTGHF